MRIQMQWICLLSGSENHDIIHSAPSALFQQRRIGVADGTVTVTRFALRAAGPQASALRDVGWRQAPSTPLPPACTSLMCAIGRYGAVIEKLTRVLSLIKSRDSINMTHYKCMCINPIHVAAPQNNINGMNKPLLSR